MRRVCPVSSAKVKYLETVGDQSYLIARFYLSFAPSPALNRGNSSTPFRPKPRAPRPSSPPSSPSLPVFKPFYNATVSACNPATLSATRRCQLARNIVLTPRSTINFSCFVRPLPLTRAQRVFEYITHAVANPVRR